MKLVSTMTAVLTLLVLVAAAGQSLCGSVHSANGIGDIVPDNLGRSRGMGGSGAADGDGSNMLRSNPALLGSFKAFSFSLEMLYSSTSTSATPDENDTYAKTDPSAVRIVLPVSKGIVLGWGLSPYSRTDVGIILPTFQDGMKITDTVRFSGGINVSSLGIAYNFKNRVLLGYSMNYHFGMIQERWERTFPGIDNINVSVYNFNRKYKGYSNSVGLVARPFKGTSMGLGYTSQSDMTLNLYSQPEDYTNPDTFISARTATLPETVRFGLCSEFGGRFKAQCDAAVSRWEDAARTAKEKEMYTDTYRVGAGVRFIPSTRVNAPYYKKIPVSAGFSAGTLYYKSYPKVGTVSEKSVTLGLEFPVRENTGSIVTSVEYGIRGDKGKNGWEETFFNIGISLIGIIK